MAIGITKELFFTQLLNTSVPGLEGIGSLYRERGEAAAEEHFARFLREFLLTNARMYFSQPDTYMENAWRTAEESDEEVAERVLKHRIMSCSVLYDFGTKNPIDWSFNPTYNNYREWTFQIARHHEWRLLARMYRKTGDERFARGLAELMSSFFEGTECPVGPRADFAEHPENPGVGVSGFSTDSWRTIEIGIRLANNWPYAILALLSSPSVSAAFLTECMMSLWENANRLCISSTSHNWLIMEMNGLFHTAVLFPFFADSEDWHRFAIRRLIEELDLQFYPDYFQFELTTGYHGAVLLNYRTVMRFCRYMGISLPEELRRTIRNAYLLYVRLMQPDGRTPALNDGGRDPVAERIREALEFFPDDPELLWAASEGSRGTPPPYTSLLMPYSGMAIMRSGWGREDSFAMLESAPFGRAHQHEDKLQVLLYAHGKQLLSDYGSYAYDTSLMRQYILSSYSHNVALVDGKGQNRRKRYTWKAEDIKKPAGVVFRETEELALAIGSYDEGFGEELIDVCHRRALLWMKRGYGRIKVPFYLVIDSFEPRDGASHSYQTLWHAPDRLQYTTDVSSATLFYGEGVSLHVIGDGAPRIAMGVKEPTMLGWKPIHATGEHEHLPVPTIIFTHSSDKTVKTPVCLVPLKDEASPIESISLSGSLLRLTLTSGGEETVDLSAYLQNEL